MNAGLDRIKPYPFEQLAALRHGVQLVDKSPLNLSIGEPRHPPPEVILQALTENVADIGRYPPTRGSLNLRTAISEWLVRRFALNPNLLQPEKHVLPVNGTREALFAIAQCVVASKAEKNLVLMPNPFYQIYEGAALLAGGEPHYLNARDDGQPDFDTVPAAVWERCALLYICTPANPTGTPLDTAALQRLCELAAVHDFIIASDECYCEIYMDEAQPPTSLLAASAALGNGDFTNCIVFHSLSKRSNAPGLRSGFVAGDADLLAQFLRYRTYHGCAMSMTIQAASIAAWRDEAHVVENRKQYRAKFAAVIDILDPVLKVRLPAAGFYLWPELGMDDVEFSRGLLAAENVTVLPGSYLARHNAGLNPGSGRIRIALVDGLSDCIEAARRLREFVASLQ